MTGTQVSLRQLPRLSLWLRKSNPWFTASNRRLCSRSTGARAAAGAGQAGYLTLEAPYSADLEVKKSRFLTTAWPIDTPEEALRCVESRRDPSASHNCWAYKVGQSYRSSDDGEPGGTAGRPILAAIEGEGLDGVCVLVIRHFGGVKLGAGGLVRAYGGAARECLKAAPKKHMAPKVTLVLQAPFELIGPIYALLEQYNAEKLREEYGGGAEAGDGSGGGMELELRVEAGAAAALAAAVQNATSGRVVPQVL